MLLLLNNSSEIWSHVCIKGHERLAYHAFEACRTVEHARIRKERKNQRVVYARWWWYIFCFVQPLNINSGSPAADGRLTFGFNDQSPDWSHSNYQRMSTDLRKQCVNAGAGAAWVEYVIFPWELCWTHVIITPTVHVPPRTSGKEPYLPMKLTATRLKTD